MGFKYQLGKCCGCKTETGKCNKNCTQRILTEQFPIDEWPCQFVGVAEQEVLYDKQTFTKAYFDKVNVVTFPLENFDLSDDFVYEVLYPAFTGPGKADPYTYHLIAPKLLFNYLATGDKGLYNLSWDLRVESNGRTKLFYFSKTEKRQLPFITNEQIPSILFIPCVLRCPKDTYYPRLKTDQYEKKWNASYTTEYSGTVSVIPGVNNKGVPAFYTDSYKIILPRLKVDKIETKDTGFFSDNFDQISESKYLTFSFDFCRAKKTQQEDVGSEDFSFDITHENDGPSLKIYDSVFKLFYPKTQPDGADIKDAIRLIGEEYWYDEKNNKMHPIGRISGASILDFKIDIDEIDSKYKFGYHFVSDEFYKLLASSIKIKAKKAIFDPRDQFEIDFETSLPNDPTFRVNRYDKIFELSLTIPNLSQNLHPQKASWRGKDLRSNITCTLSAPTFEVKYTHDETHKIVFDQVPMSSYSFRLPVKALFTFNDFANENDIVINGERYHFLRHISGAKHYEKLSLIALRNNVEGVVSNNYDKIANNTTLEGYGYFVPGSRSKIIETLVAISTLGKTGDIGFYTVSQAVKVIEDTIMLALKDKPFKVDFKSKLRLSVEQKVRYETFSKEVYVRKNSGGEYDVPFGKTDIDQPT